MASDRTALFISHATPEDNAFTIWLGSRLSAAGYEVWADVLRLRGGQDWERMLLDALRNRAFKVLLVCTPLGLAKDGVRQEIRIANQTARTIGDPEFVIPLRLEPYKPPFDIALAQYIDFRPGWPRPPWGSAARPILSRGGRSARRWRVRPDTKPPGLGPPP
jgi:hypothetical protein